MISNKCLCFFEEINKFSPVSHNFKSLVENLDQKTVCVCVDEINTLSSVAHKLKSLVENFDHKSDREPKQNE